MNEESKEKSTEIMLNTEREKKEHRAKYINTRRRWVFSDMRCHARRLQFTSKIIMIAFREFVILLSNPFFIHSRNHKNFAPIQQHLTREMLKSVNVSIKNRWFSTGHLTTTRNRKKTYAKKNGRKNKTTVKRKQATAASFHVYF